jgi:hypothetical protein
MKLYKLRKYPTSTKHTNYGFAIGVPAELGRTYPDEQQFAVSQQRDGSLVFTPTAKP